MTYLSHILKSIYSEYEILVEIGEGNAKSYPFKKINNFKYSFMARLKPNMKEQVEVDFQDFSNDEKMKKYIAPGKFSMLETVYNVAYNVAGNQYQFDKTDVGSLLRIMSTISLIVKDFVEKNNPDMLYIFGNSRTVGIEDTKKNSLYAAFIDKQLNKISGYSAQEMREGYIIFKSDKIK